MGLKQSSGELLQFSWFLKNDVLHQTYCFLLFRQIQSFAVPLTPLLVFKFWVNML